MAASSTKPGGADLAPDNRRNCWFKPAPFGAPVTFSATRITSGFYPLARCLPGDRDVTADGETESFVGAALVDRRFDQAA